MSEKRPVVLVLFLATVSIAGLMVLTGRGRARRTGGAGTVLCAGLFFPVTWAVWYVTDGRDGTAGSRPPTTL